MMMAPVIQTRTQHPVIYQQALAQGFSPLIARIIAGRLLAPVPKLAAIVQPHLQYLDAPHLLKDSDRAANRIAQAIIHQQIIGILTDYDVDGVTSHALIFRALTHYFGVSPQHIQCYIGHRLKDGYGVSPALTQRILGQSVRPALIITADCGSSDEVYIAQLKQAGIEVIVTDHHAIPAEGIPVSAYAVINPTQAGCAYPDATIAGCMVAWLLMSQVRHNLVQAQYLPPTTPKLSALLSFVALGTVADCVSLAESVNNRAVVQIGLQLINQFQEPCWIAMRELLKQPRPFTVETLGFQLAPRINARSRLEDPYAALHYLLADTLADARHYLAILDHDNQQRRQIEREMVIVARQRAEQQSERMSLVVALPEGHAGVQGIVASRLVQSFGKPALVICHHPLDKEQLSGSGRSISGLHLRQALQTVAEQYPGLFIRFGGHRGAAGFTLEKQQMPVLQQAFEQAVIAQLGLKALAPVILTDGTLPPALISLATVQELAQLQPYGREFDPPLFEGVFQIEKCRCIGSPAVHLSFTLRIGHTRYNAVWFSALPQELKVLPYRDGDTIMCAYSLSLNDYRGQQSLQLQIQHAYKVTP